MVIDVHVRRAGLEDVESLTAFNCAIARETEGKELATHTVRRGVTRGLQRGDEVTYYVAEVGGEERQVAACLMFTREWSDWRDGWLMWLQSVYVAPAYRGQGVFRTMLATATAEVQQLPDVVGMRLYVEEHNRAAQQVYFNLGFADSGYRVLEKLFSKVD